MRNRVTQNNVECITKRNGMYYLQDNILIGRRKPVFYRPKIFNGSCEDRMKDLPEKSVSLLIDDPPYGITQNKWDKRPDWNKLAQMYNKILNDAGLIYIFGRQPVLNDVMDAFKEYFDFRFELIWNKRNNPWISNYMPIPIHENIFVFKKKGTPVKKTKFYVDRVREEGDPYTKYRRASGKSSTQGEWRDITSINNGWRYPKSVLEITYVNGEHKEYCGFSSQKPLRLLKWIISVSSDIGDLILDPHAGSGSTPLAAFQLCRKSIGIELNHQNFSLIKSRLKKIKVPKKYIKEDWRF